MKRKLLALFAALSMKPTFANADEPADTELETALDQVQTKVAAFANEQTSVKKKLLALCGKLGITFANETEITSVDATLDQARDKIVTLATDRDALKTQFANERAARIEDELGLAVKQGRITEAERATWKGRLGVDAQFANELTAVRGLEVKVKTEAQTAGRVASKADLADPRSRREFCNDAVANICKEKGWDIKKDYDRAFRLGQERHPEAFGVKGKKK